SLVMDENGNQQILFKNFSGDSAANLLGRFTSGNNDIYELVKTISEFEQSSQPDTILAEIVHLSEAKNGNILFRKHVRDYEIISNGSSDLGNDHTIAVSDIQVSIKNDKIVL